MQQSHACPAPNAGTTTRDNHRSALKLGARLRGQILALVAVILALTVPTALAQPLSFTITGSGNLLVAHSHPHAGVCAGDGQYIATERTPASDFEVVSHPVGETILRDFNTSKGHPNEKRVMEADTTYLITSLYHWNRPDPQDSKLQAESFAWAVQTQLPSWGWFSTRAPSDGGELAQKMLSHAMKYAGPYQLEPKVERQPDGSVAVTNVGVQAASGAWVPGLQGKLSLHGPAQFQNQQTTLEITSATAPVQLPIHYNAYGEISVEITFTGLPANSIDILQSPAYQDLISVQPANTEISSKAGLKLLPPNLTVAFTTKVESERLRVDEPAVDNIFLQADNWPETIDGDPVELQLRAELYGPFSTPVDESEEVPQDAPLAASRMVTVTGPGTYQVRATAEETGHLLDGALPTWEPGYYSWVVSALQYDQNTRGEGGYADFLLMPDVMDRFGIKEESFQVVTTDLPPVPPQGGDSPTPPETTPPQGGDSPTPPETTPPPEQTPPGESEDGSTTKVTAPPPTEGKELARTGVSDLYLPALAIALAGAALKLFASAYRLR
ncbi:MAG: hypothetical protein Q4P06_01890 [Actinomycetaceae bacterium]|nr:hypothetical protein [Actinomycetaceae bacterium]